MFELLVPPEKAQLARFNGDKRAYDIQLRPALMVQAIEQLQEAQVEPDVWKIEGLDRREDCTKRIRNLKSEDFQLPRHPNPRQTRPGQ